MRALCVRVDALVRNGVHVDQRSARAALPHSRLART
jgi:hypothetical protein